MTAKSGQRTANLAVVICGALLTTGVLFSSGCSTFNGSPLHSALSEARLQQRVDRRFPLGMRKDAVIARLEHMGFEPQETPVQLKQRADESSVQVALEAPWWRLHLLTRRLALIRFYFDTESNLSGTNIEYGMIGV